MGIKFQTGDKWLRCLFDVSKQTWLPGFLNIPQSLPVTGYSLNTPLSILNFPAQGLGCPSPRFGYLPFLYLWPPDCCTWFPLSPLTRLRVICLLWTFPDVTASHYAFPFIYK